ncbi:AtpZ/AtpI family protein [Ancylomarina salipaludis]|uniref:AtpZ/AtpI family protein n=1 Tax=Ancylomarina salipaludis TaxID=2501299 RepID=A0A4Q1JLM1_9BACT|nr:AtpZ/AtpI family protein [Ancylomarina salipaludis]RXQ95001.1 AtpZ/AtpI family protein [Ancylomarina salipaludis]
MKKKQSNKVDAEKKKRQLREAARYSGLAFQMIAVILLVLFAGMQADKYLENDFPGFTVFGAFLGVILSLYIALKDFFKKDS